MHTYYARIIHKTISFETNATNPPSEMALLMPILLSKWRTLYPSLWQIALTWNPNGQPLLLGLFLDRKAQPLPLPQPSYSSSLQTFAAQTLSLFASARRTQRIASLLIERFNTAVNALHDQNPALRSILEPLRPAGPAPVSSHPYPLESKLTAHVSPSSPLQTGYVLIRTSSIKIQVNARIQILINTQDASGSPNPEQVKLILNSWFTLLDKAKSNHTETLYTEL